MAKNIKGNKDGKNGENESYTIVGRGTVSRTALVKEVEAGKHPNHHVYNQDGNKYVRANPDDKDGNNIN
ncbi:DUF3892 domain-containing protein [Vreelandella venusta]|uniref:DUF3892 domain-containing protein n=1 Tax=Vreelandella venusta TaxID=44935 RepID=UPI004044BECA